MRTFDKRNREALLNSLKEANEQLDKSNRVFESMEKEGYVNASKMDLYATKWFNNSHKVGLIFH